MPNSLLTTASIDRLRLIDIWPVLDPLDLALGEQTGLGTDAPVLLLPVGLSARFSTDRTQLRVRIQPDTVHVDNHQYTLTADERRLGDEFWQAAAADGGDRAAAWHRLVTSVGTSPRSVNRAMWIVRGTDPAGASPAGEPDQRCMAMPDRWLVIAWNGTAVAGHAISAPVARDLPVDAPREDTPLHEWLTDFATAETMGMAVTITFATPTDRLDLLLAVGLRGQASADDTVAEVERLLGAHRYTGGLEFLAQGTPTNNTPQTRAAWRSDPDPDLAVARELDPAPVVPVVPGSNVEVLATALGVPATGALRSLWLGERAEQDHAKAMLQLLWPVTGGEFLQVLLTDNVGKGKMIPSSVEAFARDHATNYVRARGPLPVLRVGRQPYGVLPATSLKRWAPHGAEPAELSGLHRRLQSWWPFWEAAADTLPRVGHLVSPSGGGAAQVVAEILGQSPVPDPTGYVAWTVLPPNFSYSIDPNLFGNPVSGDLATGLVGTAWHAMIADVKLATKRPAAVICPVADENTAARLAALAAINRDYAALQAFPADPTDLVTQVAQRSLLRSMDRDLQDFAGELGLRVADELRLGDAVLQTAVIGDLDAVMLPSIDRLTVAQIGIVDDAVAPDTTISEMLINPDLVSAVLGPARTPAPEHADAVAGLGVLSGLGADDLTLLFGETIDLYSNRYDAWVTSLATRRLATLRAARPTGVHLGGYGWLVNLEARERTVVADPPPGVSATEPTPLFDLIGDAGAVHAPSVQHAATAAVLRHGDLGDRAEGLGLGDTERRFDLTSASARRARWLIEAMEAGQPFAALLGYRVERLLQDLGLAEVIDPVRRACPLVNGEAVDHAENALTIPPHDVVDGLTLWRRLTGDLAPDGLPPLPALPADVQRDLAFSVDAVADLLVVDGVHNIVGGDHARAQATLTGLAWGEAPSSDLRSLTEMRDRLSIPVLLAAVVTDAAPRAGWAPNRPRALVAPAAEAFAQRMLPDPSTCLVTVEREGQDPVDVAVADLGVCALDVVNDGPATGETGSLLEARLLAAAGSGAVRLASVPAVGPAPAPADGRCGWPQLRALARRVRAALASARPLTADDLVVEQPQPVAPSAEAAGSVAACRAAVDAQLAALQPAVEALRALVDAADAAESDGDLPTADVAALRSTLSALEPFGVGGSVPLPSDDVLGCARTALVHGAAAAGERANLTTAGQRVVEGAPIPSGQADGAMARLAQVARTALGDATVMAPIVDLPGGTGPDAAPTSDELTDWIGELGEVRATTRGAMALWLAAEALGGAAPELVGLQYPAQPGESWVGGYRGAPRPWTPPRSVRRAMVYERLGDAAATGRGLVLDSWAEEIPVPDDETTGLAVHINASDARPPQNWLLAVPPDPAVGEWRLGDLVAILTETLELARFRASEPPADLPQRQVLPLVYIPDGIEGTSSFSDIFSSVLNSAAISSLTVAHMKGFGDGE